MCSVITISIVIVFIGLVHTERNIIPSKAVCEALPNEEFAVDLRRCQNRCEFYGRNWDCPRNYYKPLGDCYCKRGFARFEEDGKCVSVTANATCAKRLPIARNACTVPNEKYSSSVVLGVCDTNCLTYGCLYDDNRVAGPIYKWAPNCDCKENYNRRLSNGTCVHVSDPRCVAEYQTSPARCTALGQIYMNNAPCQPECYDKTYCPPAGAACICPPGKVRYNFEESYYAEEENLWHRTKMMACFYPEDCPIMPA